MIISVFVMQYELRFVLEPATTGTTSEATSEASATRTASAEASTTTTGTARTTRTSKATTTVLKASKEVQTIDDVNHSVAGDGVILCIVARQGCDGTAEGGLLVQDIVELE